MADETPFPGPFHGEDKRQKHLNDPHRDEPAQVAKRVADLEIMVARLVKWSKIDDPSTWAGDEPSAPDPLADPPKMLRGRDKGEKR